MNSLDDLLESLTPESELQPLGLHEKEIAESLAYLSSPDMVASMETDPYWPKWNSPWWHMALLLEMGLAHLIPEKAVYELQRALNFHYLHFFPKSENEVPTGQDPVAHILCHCALATAVRVVIASGQVLDSEPWVRRWLVHYQLPDGGYNCDEKAYLTHSGHSSMVSTLDALEAIMELGSSGISANERMALDGGATYLLRRKLLRSVSKDNQLVNEDWTRLTFPRFYEYDVLRALALVVRWANFRRRRIQWRDIKEAVTTIADKTHDGILTVERQYFATCKTRVPARAVAGVGAAASSSSQQESQSDPAILDSLSHETPYFISGQESTHFPLLLSVSKEGSPCPFLTRQWHQTIEGLKALRDTGLLMD